MESGGRTAGGATWGTGRVVASWSRSKIAPLGVVPTVGDLIWPGARPGTPIPAATAAITSAVDHRMTVLPFGFKIVSL
ncbi:MAG: hypothetical protein DME04_02120 [Candidatus Rokuibacteriota bacterium]|nr:MAG: hypothetical protein DME04_02120 [Candidatus Rokubacteria bacterium]